MCFGFLYNFCLQHFSFYEEAGEIWVVLMYSTRYSCPTLMKIFWTVFRNIQISNFMKICPVGAELFYADGRTDRHEATSRFSQFCESA